jgi:hypothetical protein
VAFHLCRLDRIQNDIHLTVGSSFRRWLARNMTWKIQYVAFIDWTMLNCQERVDDNSGGKEGRGVVLYKTFL